MKTHYLTTDDYDLKSLQQGSHHDPFVVLGCHPRDDHWVVRAWLPTATSATLEGGIALQPLNNSGMFIATLSEEQKQFLPVHYWVEWVEASGQVNRVTSPYTFLPQVGEIDLHLFAEGQHWNLYDILGANPRQVDGIDGVLFAVWAPSAERVSVVGDFNGWAGLRHPM
ncbi:MAG: 1,4-alpha-glucan branching enzyme, partial [Desulfuromusa sp.]|nr:1,4-alpha-glucan branching enzyme [Desulfuromusa sp.]